MERTLSIAGRAVYVQVEGAGQPGPAVVLEAGLAGFSAVWAWVVSEVARFAPVVAYDRAGLGGSEPSSGPRDADSIACELDMILQAAGPPGPYVLAGFSMGGLHARRYAHRCPQSVCGMVLADPCHPDQSRRLPGGRAEDRLTRWLMSTALGLARTGLLRPSLVPRSLCAGLPPKAEQALRTAYTTCAHLETTRREFAVWEESCRQVRESGSLGDLPLVVLSAGRPADPSLRVWHTLHREIAALSTRGRHQVVEGADHVSLLHRREYALQVTEAIRQVVSAARTAGGSPVEPPSG
jgi:pimeloyl-ACP methyl ester carboxylesterase